MAVITRSVPPPPASARAAPTYGPEAQAACSSRPTTLPRASARTSTRAAPERPPGREQQHQQREQVETERQRRERHQPHPDAAARVEQPGVGQRARGQQQHEQEEGEQQPAQLHGGNASHAADASRAPHRSGRHAWATSQEYPPSQPSSALTVRRPGPHARRVGEPPDPSCLGQPLRRTSSVRREPRPAPRRAGRLPRSDGDPFSMASRRSTLPTAAPADASFADLGLPDALVETLEDLGITKPFPIQAATLPDALSGRDVLGRGRTGSGKTYAFLLPVVARLAARPVSPRATPPAGADPVPDPRAGRPDRRRRRPAGRGPRAAHHHHLRRRRASARRPTSSARASTCSSPARAASRTSSARASPASTTSRSPCSTRPTTWPTSASCPA